jgi:beta-glucosidase
MLTASIDVTNSGARDGKEVVQLYVHDVESRLTRPPRELKRFQKIALKPGETKTVTFTLTERDLAYYDPAQKGWVAEPGTFKLLVGSSSRDIHATAAFSLRGDAVTATLGADSRLGQVLASQRGRAVLRKHLGSLMQNNWRWDASYTLEQLTRFRPERWSKEIVAKIDTDLRKDK